MRRARNSASRVTDISKFSSPINTLFSSAMEYTDFETGFSRQNSMDVPSPDMTSELAASHTSSSMSLASSYASDPTFQTDCFTPTLEILEDQLPLLFQQSSDPMRTNPVVEEDFLQPLFSLENLSFEDELTPEILSAVMLSDDMFFS